MRASPSRTARRWEIGVTAAFLAAMSLIYLARCLYVATRVRLWGAPLSPAS